MSLKFGRTHKSSSSDEAAGSPLICSGSRLDLNQKERAIHVHVPCFLQSCFVETGQDTRAGYNLEPGLPQRFVKLQRYPASVTKRVAISKLIYRRADEAQEWTFVMQVRH